MAAAPLTPDFPTFLVGDLCDLKKLDVLRNPAKLAGKVRSTMRRIVLSCFHRDTCVLFRTAGTGVAFFGHSV
jgi:hypothetical protein